MEVPMRRLLLTVMVLILGIPASGGTAWAQRYSFVVTGDGRSEKTPRPGMDENGINKTEMKELVSEILRIKPKFVLFSGDLAYGDTTEREFRTQLEAWLAIMKPVYQAGIHVYPLRGNHDASSTNAGEVWNEVFSGPYALPGNGPVDERNVTFTAVEENALIVGMDQGGWHQHAIHLGWLREQLAQNKQPLVLVMGHEMAFRAGHHTDNLDNNASLRDGFIAALGSAGARVYFAGHDHFYDHLEITDPKGHPDLDIHQFVIGTAGAPFYHGSDYDGNNGSWTIRPMKHIEDTFGYVLGEVDGLHVRMSFMGRSASGAYQPMDAFEYDASMTASPSEKAGH
jgi:hypothetical protein